MARRDQLAASRRKIFVFLFTVLTLVVIIGSLIYVIEGRDDYRCVVAKDGPVETSWVLIGRRDQ